MRPTVACAELLLSGCTTASDHNYVWPNGCRIDDQVAVAREIGFRFHAARGSMSVGQSQGGLPPDSCVEDEPAILADTQRAIETFHDAARFAMTRVVVAPCSPFSVSADLMRESVALARSYGVHSHTHLAETLDEERYCVEHFGRRPVELAEDLGWIGPDVWHAHMVHPSADEVGRLGRIAHRRRALPDLEHAARQRHRADPRAGRCRRARGPRRRRLGLQRQLAPAR